jgi:group I intron endonuclease
MPQHYLAFFLCGEIMTIGIYALYWEEPDLIYIGQSKDIETRFYEHLRLLCVGKHPNYKINRTYDTYGEPSTSILEVCSIDELDRLEIQWMEEFNSIHAGLNITPGGIGTGKDCEHGAAKFSRSDILKAANLLLDPANSLLDIKKLTNISTAVLSSIANAKRHTWIFKEGICLSAMLSARDIRAKAQRHTSPYHNKLVKSPNGNIFNVGTNLSEFARLHNFKSSGRLHDLLSGKRNSHKGYTLYKESK